MLLESNEPFSREEIFIANGQFDAFVELTFGHNTEAYKKFGRVLLGTFYYTREERKAMEEAIAKEPITHSNGHIKFSPSDIPKELDAKLKEELDRYGILNTDIELIRSLNIPRSNRYTTEGEREIQNKIVVEFDAGGMSSDQMKLGYLRMKIAAGTPMIKEEWEQYCGLELHHDSKKLATVMSSGKVPNGLSQNEQRFYYLDTKWLHSQLNEVEMKEYDTLQTTRSKEKAAILSAELKKSTEDMKDLAVHYKDHLRRIMAITIDFETHVILPYQFPVWWNLERFLHIYLRHVKETNVGDRFVGKSLFKYSFSDVRRIVSATIEKVYPDIEEHFKKATTTNFKRKGSRAVYHDGVYYRFEIKPSGLLEVFHPEEDIIKGDPE